MEIRIINRFKTSKRGNSQEEYEDAYAISKDNSKIAISDGATEASFSKEWAQILVNHFVNNPVEIITSEWLEELYNIFNAKVDISKLPWYAQNKIIEQGSYATLTGVYIDIEDESFTFISIGDSCLFLVDENGVYSFPFRSVEEFNSRPYLISTLKYNNFELNNKVYQKSRHDKFQLGRTRLYLATDALSCWLVKEHCSNREPWKILDELMEQSEFINLIDKLRDSGDLKNDDVTLIIVEVINNREENNSGISINE